jgi:hypothetical protein
MLLDIIDRRQFNSISMPDLNRDILRALIEEWRTKQKRPSQRPDDCGHVFARFTGGWASSLTTPPSPPIRFTSAQLQIRLGLLFMSVTAAFDHKEDQVGHHGGLYQGRVWVHQTTGQTWH